MIDAKVEDLATVSYPWHDTEFIKQQLGTARLAIVPVVYGLAEIDLNN